MIDATAIDPITTVTETKATAAQIEANCPVILQDLGKRIAAHSEKAGKCEQKAEQHYNTIAQLLAEARGACDHGGFDAFRERFFPKLRKSRVYELLAIGTGKKSHEEIRAGGRARVAKYRANSAAVPVSVTVTETKELGDIFASEESSEIKAPSIASDQMPEPGTPRRAIAPGNEAVRTFTTLVMELGKRTAKRPPQHFSTTFVPVDMLERLGTLLIGIAKIKKSEVVEPVPEVGLASTGPVGQSPVAAERAAHEASADLGT